MSEGSLVDNAADPEQVKRGKETEERERLEFLLTFRNVVARADARRVFWKYLERCGVFDLSYRRNHRPEDTAFREGERNIGLMIQAEWIEADAQSYMAAMIASKREGDRKNDSRRKAGRGHGAGDESSSG